MNQTRFNKKHIFAQEGIKKWFLRVKIQNREKRACRSYAVLKGLIGMIGQRAEKTATQGSNTFMFSVYCLHLQDIIVQHDPFHILYRLTAAAIAVLSLVVVFLV